MGLDSVELVMEVENHFAISIPDQEPEKAYTIGRLVNCVAAIRHVKSYDFSLRDNSFSLLKNDLRNIHPELPDFSILSKVIETLDIHNRELITELERRTGLKLPGIYFIEDSGPHILQKVKKWFAAGEVDLKTIRWKKFIDIMLAKNIEQVIPPDGYTSKYEIYLAIMKITVDKTGVDYEEVGIEKSFTDDLGVD